MSVSSRLSNISVVPDKVDPLELRNSVWCKNCTTTALRRPPIGLPICASLWVAVHCASLASNLASAVGSLVINFASWINVPRLSRFWGSWLFKKSDKSFVHHLPIGIFALKTAAFSPVHLIVHSKKVNPFQFLPTPLEKLILPAELIAGPPPNDINLLAFFFSKTRAFP